MALQNFFLALADVINIADAVLHKAGFFKLLGIQGPISQLAGTDWVEMKKELLALTDEQRLAIEAAFIGRLSLTNPDWQAKLAPGKSILDEVFVLGEESLNFGKDAFSKGKAIVIQFKNLFGI